MVNLGYALSQHMKNFGEFKETFPTVEEVDCFLKKPIPMPDLVKKVKSQLGLLQIADTQSGYWPKGGSIVQEYTFLKVTVISFGRIVQSYD